MKLILILFVCLFVNATAFCQKPNTAILKQQLDSIYVIDQKYREMLSLVSDTVKADSIAKLFGATKETINGKLWDLQSKIDASNLIFVENLINKYGYPGKTLVGEPTNEAAWYVIQHSDKIKSYFKLIQEAGNSKELPLRLVAMMQDRLLMEEGKEQIYGTQATCRKMKNGNFECIIWPIQDAANVNKRRQDAGLLLTVEKNAERLGVSYKELPLSYVQ